MENKKSGYPSIDKPWLQFYDEGVYDKALGSPKNQSIWDIYKPILENYGDIPVIRYFNHDFSNEEYLELIEKWAKTFRMMGVEADEMVPIYGTWSPDIAAMFFALNSIGAHPYFEKLDITPSALLEETTGAKVAVVHSALWKDYINVFKDNRFRKVIISSPADHVSSPLKHLINMKSVKSNCRDKEVMQKDSRFISAPNALGIGTMYTGYYMEPFKSGRIASITSSSGTTSSRIKGIVDTNESIIANITGTALGEPSYTKGGRVLTSTPPTASTALNCLYLLPLYKNMTCVMDPIVSEESYYDQVMRYKPNVTIMTGSYFESFFRRVERELKSGKKVDLSFAEFFTIGGSGTTPEKLAWMNDLMHKCHAPHDLFIGYGSSELFGVVSVDKHPFKSNGIKNNLVTDVGIPLPGFTVGVFGEDGNELKYNERGELYIKGPSLMEGYFNKPDLTQKAIKDGWFKTGDICEIDEEGYIYYYGRKKDTAVIDSHEVYLFDVANVIRDYFGLKECYVEKKHMEDGLDAIVVYFVQNQNGEVCDNKTMCESIDDFCQTNGINISGFIEFEEAIPTSPTTIKPVNRLLNGFVKYKNGIKYDVSFTETSEDTYSMQTKEASKEMVRTKKSNK